MMPDTEATGKWCSRDGEKGQQLVSRLLQLLRIDLTTDRKPVKPVILMEPSEARLS